jgi:hypothetical protein
MAADLKPVACSFQWKMNVLAGFQLENGETSRASHREELWNAMLAARLRENPGINKSRIQRGIDARDVFKDQSFEPALGLPAVKRVARFRRERMAIILELLEQVLQSREGRSIQLRAGIGTTEEDAPAVPSGKRETSEAQQDFAGLPDGMTGNGARGQGHDRIERGARQIEECFGFALRNQPGILISGAAWIDLFKGLLQRVALVEFDGEILGQGAGAVGQVPCTTSWQNKAKHMDRATGIRVAYTIEPEQGKGEAAFDALRRLPVGGKHRRAGRTLAEDPADMVAGKRMLEIGRGGEKFQGFLRELRSKETAQPVAKCLPRKIALGALKLEANKFEAVRLRAPESLDGKRQPLVGMIRDGQHAARKIVIF